VVDPYVRRSCVGSRNHRRARRCAIGLAVVLAAFPTQAQPYGLGDRPPTPREQAYLDEHLVEVRTVRPNALSTARAISHTVPAGSSLDAAAAVSSAVDNSTLMYFPPIRSQGGQGSCTCWAACYYYNTFTQARDHELDVSGGDNTRICSPAFLYPLINDGSDDGAVTAYAVARLNDVGCCSWALKPYDQYDYTSWPTEAAWVEALGRRTSTAHTISGSTQSGLDAIKQHVANGNVAAVRFTVYDNVYDIYPDNTTGINNRVYYAPAGLIAGGHAVTIVGYDDDRSYTDHRDGQTHYGAFLVANSWGSTWGWYNSTETGSRGFFWVAYRMFLEGTFGPSAYYNDDRPQYGPTLYAVAGLNHDQRGRITYGGGIGPTDSPEFTGPEPIADDGGTAIAITDAKRVAVDLTDGAALFQPGVPKQVFVSLAVHVRAKADGTITSADFVHDLDGDGLFETVPSPDPIVTVPRRKTGYATAELTPAYNIDVVAIGIAASNAEWVEITWSGASPDVVTIYWTADPPGGARSWDTLDGPALADVVDNGDGTWTWTDKGTDPDMTGHAPGDVPLRCYILSAD